MCITDHSGINKTRICRAPSSYEQFKSLGREGAFLRYFRDYGANATVRYRCSIVMVGLSIRLAAGNLLSTDFLTQNLEYLVPLCGDIGQGAGIFVLTLFELQQMDADLPIYIWHMQYDGGRHEAVGYTKILRSEY